jgi:glycerol-3-phosphate acyltransferase PlsY
MPAVIPLLYLVLSYLIGAIPFGWLFCKLVKGVDVRDRGSKNIGATNVSRVLGAKWAALTFILDIGKGLIVVLMLGKHLVGNSNWALVFGAAAIVGHCFPIYLMSKGGKGGATTFGVALAMHPVMAIIAFVVWIVIVAVSRWVSLATMIAVLSFAIGNCINNGGSGFDKVFFVALALLVVVMHRENIKRLLDRTESKFTLGGGGRNA